MSLIRVLLLLSIIGFVSCSRERLFLKETPSFVSLIPENLQKAPQVITLNSRNDLPFITEGGNSIWFDLNWLYRPKDFSTADYPVRLEITELLSVKDIILQEKPTVSGGRLLTTDGQIKVQVFKGKDELQVFQGALRIDMNGIFPGQGDPEMLLFLGEETKDGFNWQVDSSGCLIEAGRILFCDNISTQNNSGWDYALFPYQLGWINIDKFADYNQTTSLRFVSDTDIQHVSKFLYFPDIKSILQVYNHGTTGVPVGMKAVIIAFAFTGDGSVFSYFEETVIRENQTVSLKLAPTTREELFKKLEGL